MKTIFLFDYRNEHFEWLPSIGATYDPQFNSSTVKTVEYVQWFLTSEAPGIKRQLFQETNGHRIELDFDNLKLTEYQQNSILWLKITNDHTEEEFEMPKNIKIFSAYGSSDWEEQYRKKLRHTFRKMKNIHDPLIQMIEKNTGQNIAKKILQQKPYFHIHTTIETEYAIQDFAEIMQHNILILSNKEENKDMRDDKAIHSFYSNIPNYPFGRIHWAENPGLPWIFFYEADIEEEDIEELKIFLGDYEPPIQANSYYFPIPQQNIDYLNKNNFFITAYQIQYDFYLWAKPMLFIRDHDTWYYINSPDQYEEIYDLSQRKYNIIREIKKNCAFYQAILKYYNTKLAYPESTIRPIETKEEIRELIAKKWPKTRSLEKLVARENIFTKAFKQWLEEQGLPSAVPNARIKKITKDETPMEIMAPDRSAHSIGPTHRHNLEKEMSCNAQLWESCFDPDFFNLSYDSSFAFYSKSKYKITLWQNSENSFQYLAFNTETKAVFGEINDLQLVSEIKQKYTMQSKIINDPEVKSAILDLMHKNGHTRANLPLPHQFCMLPTEYELYPDTKPNPKALDIDYNAPPPPQAPKPIPRLIFLDFNNQNVKWFMSIKALNILNRTTREYTGWVLPSKQKQIQLFTSYAIEGALTEIDHTTWNPEGPINEDLPLWLKRKKNPEPIRIPESIKVFSEEAYTEWAKNPHSVSELTKAIPKQTIKVDSEILSKPQPHVTIPPSLQIFSLDLHDSLKDETLKENLKIKIQHSLSKLLLSSAQPTITKDEDIEYYELNLKKEYNTKDISTSKLTENAEDFTKLIRFYPEKIVVLKDWQAVLQANEHPSVLKNFGIIQQKARQLVAMAKIALDTFIATRIPSTQDKFQNKITIKLSGKEPKLKRIVEALINPEPEITLDDEAFKSMDISEKTAVITEIKKLLQTQDSQKTALENQDTHEKLKYSECLKVQFFNTLKVKENRLDSRLRGNDAKGIKKLWHQPKHTACTIK